MEILQYKSDQSKTHSRTSSLSLSKNNIVRAKFNDIQDDYIFQSTELGEGGYGKVYLAVDKKTGYKRAIKHVQIKKNLKNEHQKSKIL